MDLSVGRIVHLDAFPDDSTLKCRAAIVGDIDDETIFLNVHNVHNKVNPITNVAVNIALMTKTKPIHDASECPKDANFFVKFKG